MTPDQLDQILKLRDQEKLTWTEISKRLGLPMSTVYGAYCRANN